jgi:predicted RecB family nuclease
MLAPLIRQHILDYNEDDCRAAHVVLDGIRQLSCDPSNKPEDVRVPA